MHNPIEVQMKQYLIKNSDILHNGKIFPEGTTIELEDKDAQSLSDYLVTLSVVEVSENKSKSLELKKRNK